MFGGFGVIAKRSLREFFEIPPDFEPDIQPEAVGGLDARFVLIKYMVS